MKIKLLKPLLVTTSLTSMFPLTLLTSCNTLPTSLIIEGDDYAIAGQQIKLTYKFDKTAKLESSKWTTNDPDVATVDKDGNVTTKKEGLVEIGFDATIGDKNYSAIKQLVVIDPSSVKFIEFLNKYSQFLNNYLTSTKQYKFQPVGEYADMGWHDQIVDHMVFTTFSTYPNKHFLRISTLKQRTFNFCVGGNTIIEMYQMITGAYDDCVRQLEDESYTGHHLVEQYEISDDSISYVVNSTNGTETFYLIDIRINKNGYIEKFNNTTDTNFLKEHSTEYGTIEVKYVEK